MDCSPPGSSVHGIFQARILEWIAMPSSLVSVKVKVAQLLWWSHGLYSPWNSPGQNIGVGNLSLLQGIFPTQGLNSGLPHFGWILYQVSHKGSSRILECIAYPFSSWFSQPRNWTAVSCIAGGCFTSWATREAQELEWVAYPFSSRSSRLISILKRKSWKWSYFSSK